MNEPLITGTILLVVYSILRWGIWFIGLCVVIRVLLKGIVLNKYLLEDKTIDWHKLYFDAVPGWMTDYSPPGGHYNYAAYLYQPHRYLIDLYSSLKYFIQRGRRGWSNQDAWNWCHHHAKVMVGVLQYLRKNAHSYPMGSRPAVWNKKLSTMELGFQALLDEDNDCTSYKKLSNSDYRKLMFSRRRKLMLGLKYFRENYRDLWD